MKGRNVMYEIYQLTSPSGKHYIGQTRQSSEIRFKQHVNAWKKWIEEGRPRKSYQTKLFYAFDSYPPETWRKTILVETDDVSVCNQKEKELIETLDTVNNGYNVQNGGQEGWIGLTLSDEHRSNQSAGRSAYYETEEGKAWKAELSRRKKGQLFKGAAPGWNKGIPHKDETKEKTSQSMKDWWQTPEGIVAKEKKAEIAKAMGKRNKGRQKTPEQIAAHREKMIGHVQPQSQKDAVSEKMSKTYIITHPDGHEEVIKGLRRWCLAHGLSDANITRKSGSKGYRARLATPEEITTSSPGGTAP